MTHHLAPSLVTLRSEVNAAWPRRDRGSDGWIGDIAHGARASDHNPDYSAGGVVRAIDIDKDGIDVDRLLRAVINDARTAYIIWNRRIWTRGAGWAAYKGANGHTAHVHVSIRHGRGAETSSERWGVLNERTGAPGAATKTVTPTPQEDPDMGLLIRNNEPGPGFGAVIFSQGGVAVNVSGPDYDNYQRAGVRTVELSRQGFLEAQAKFTR